PAANIIRLDGSGTVELGGGLELNVPVPAAVKLDIKLENRVIPGVAELKLSAAARCVAPVKSRKSEVNKTVSPGVPELIEAVLSDPVRTPLKVTVSRFVREPVPTEAGVSRMIWKVIIVVTGNGCCTLPALSVAGVVDVPVMNA